MPTITPLRQGKPQQFEYAWWAPGVQLVGTVEAPISFDSETRLILGPLDVPEPALGMAYDGKKLVLLHPENFGAFLLAHRSAHFVAHNAAFDWWVLHNECKRRGDARAVRILWDMADAGRLHDTMILDQLIQLGTGRYRKAGGGYGDDVKVYATSLAILADEARSVELDKGDQYRLRFGELLGFSKQQMEDHVEWAGFVGYALPDAIATFEVYPHVRSQAIDIMRRTGWKENAQRYEIAPDALKKWGPLSEAIQVRGAISLAHLSRTPLRIDMEARQRLEDETRLLLAGAFEAVELRDKEILRRHSAKARKYTPGSYKIAAKTGLPSFNDGVLKRVLEEEAKALQVSPPQSPGKKGGTSTSAKEWAKYAEKSPFIQAWGSLEKNAKLLQFLVELNSQEIYTSYDLLKRTGRTSAASHKVRKGEKAIPSVNIQQMPRDERIRGLFLADVGDKLAAADYAFIELRTLAAACVGRYGRSKLKDVIVQHAQEGGADPHEVMAAALMKLPMSEFKKLPKEEQKKARQNGKALNFGFPGGLGVAKFIAYAQQNYGVTFTEAEAKEAKKAWFTTYPEMRDYLGDTTAEALAYNLGMRVCDIRAIWPCQSQWHDPLRRVKDTLYEAEWAMSKEDAAALMSLIVNHRRELLPLLEETATWRKLHDDLFLFRACTLTGRVRGRTGYCDGANTPFQSSASDGGKEAVWRLLYAGFNVKAFIHDEILVGLAEKTAARDVKRVEEHMVKGMEGVLGLGIPVAVEAKVGDKWAK